MKRKGLIPRAKWLSEEKTNRGFLYFYPKDNNIKRIYFRECCVIDPVLFIPRFRQGFLNVFYCFIRRPGAPSPPPTTADPNQQHYMMRQMRANSNANVLTTDLGTNNLNRSHLNLLSTMTSASAASSSSRLTQNGGRRKSSTDPSRFPLLPPSDNNGIQRVPLEESNNTNRGLDLTVEGVKGKTGQTFLWLTTKGGSERLI